MHTVGISDLYASRFLHGCMSLKWLLGLMACCMRGRARRRAPGSPLRSLDFTRRRCTGRHLLTASVRLRSHSTSDPAHRIPRATGAGSATSELRARRRRCRPRALLTPARTAHRQYKGAANCTDRTSVGRARPARPARAPVFARFLQLARTERRRSGDHLSLMGRGLAGGGLRKIACCRVMATK